MSNPLKNLNQVKKIKSSLIIDGHYRLGHNELKLLEKGDPCFVIEIYEEKENELVLIDSRLSEDGCAIVGSECRPSDVDSEKWKKTDIMYLFAAYQPKKNDHCYAYEMKHRIGFSEEIIFEMLHQCACTCFYCKQLYEKAYYSENIGSNSNVLNKLETHVGVVTENFDKETLLHNWIEPKKKDIISSTPQNFFEQKIITQQNETEKQLKILQDFYEGHATINGMNLIFDVRLYNNPNGTILKFIDGILQKAT